MLREQVFVSVVMSSYNHAEYVGKAIESVLKQTYHNLELLIADDGSTDNSAEVISCYDDSRITFTRFEENTAFAGWEDVMSKAKGKYIACIGSDDMWEPDLLEKYISFLEEHEEYGCCFCVPRVIDENDNPIEDGDWDDIFNRANRTKEEWFRLIYKEGNCICAPSMCIRRDLFERLGGFRFQYRQLQDYELWLRLLQITNIYIYPERLVKYRFYPQGGNHNISMPTLESELRNNMELKYIKYDIMENLTEDFFIRAFDDELKLRPESEGFCVECEKYFVMLDSPGVHPESAIVYFFQHYNDKNFRKCMEGYYHVTRKTFWELTGSDFDKAEQALQNIETIKQLSEVNAQLRQLVEVKTKQLDIIRSKLETLAK